MKTIRAMSSVARFAFIVLGLSLMSRSLAASAVSDFNQRAMREECSEFSEAEMQICLSGKVSASQRRLASAERFASNRLSAWDEDSQYVTIAKSKLARSNKTFAQWRKT